MIGLAALVLALLYVVIEAIRRGLHRRELFAQLRELAAKDQEILSQLDAVIFMLRRGYRYGPGPDGSRCFVDAQGLPIPDARIQTEFRAWRRRNVRA